MDKPRASVIVTLEAKIQVKVTDEGYLGTGVSVQEHVNKAVQDSANWRFMVKQGTLDPLPVQAVVHVQSVLIIPQEG